MATALREAAETAPIVQPDGQTLADTYVYLLGRALVIRQEHMDRRAAQFFYNEIKYNPVGSADFVNPNLDVAYLEAWIAVDERAASVLYVPKIGGRYYTVQILDEWGEVIVNINERTFPSKPWGFFAFVLPGSTAAIPKDAARIELHSHKAKMLARVELKDDPAGAVALQQQFKMASLGHPVIAPPPAMAYFDNDDLIGVEIFDSIDARLASALDVSPAAAEMQQKVRAVAAYAASGPDARAAIDKRLREVVIPQFKVFAFTQSAPYRDHWVGGGQTGNYGADYRLRTVVDYAGIWGNTPEEVIYFVASRDAAEAALDGSNTYVIHFPPDRLPGGFVDAYWSVILVSVPEYRVVANALGRYNLNSHSPLISDADGGLTIAIGPEPAAGVAESNWLPSAPGKPFQLTFRAYVPKEAVKQGAWSPPAVVRAG